MKDANTENSTGRLFVDYEHLKKYAIRGTKKPGYVERRLRPVMGGVYENPYSNIFSVEIGRVRIDTLSDPDWKRQLAAFLNVYGRIRSNDFTKKTSEETLRNRHDILFSTMELILKDRHLRTLAQVKPRFLPRMFELWTEKKIGKRAQINYYNVMRWYWRVFGMQIPAISHYEVEKGEFTINRNATQDNSWTGNGVDFNEIYEKLNALDPVGARLFKAMKTYGFRVKEALRLEPHEADGGNRLHVTKGTKTGRPRQLEFEVLDDMNLRRVLDELKAEVPEGCHLAWSHLTLKQAKKKIGNLAAKIGLTKKGLGVTPKGLRAEFAIDLLEKLSGEVAPVRGGGIGINYKALSAARQVVTEAMGHNRKNATGPYYGSFLTMEREQLRHFNRSWDRLEPLMPKVTELLKEAGVDNLYWIGSRALGARGDVHPYEFVLPPHTDGEAAIRLSATISDLIMEAIGVDCSTHAWEGLPGVKQALWETEAIPLFEQVGPQEYMRDRLIEQRMFRMKGAH